MVTAHALNHIRLFYASYFAAMGLILPFFPVWLDGRGLDSVTIGLLTGLLALAKVIAPPWVGHQLDRRPTTEQHNFIVLASLLAAVSAAAFGWITHIWLLALLTLIFGMLWAAVLPLTDGLSVTVSEHELADYGRLRAWGSIGFVITSLAGGLWLVGPHIDTFPIMLALLMLVLAYAARGFPILPVNTAARQSSAPFSAGFYLLLAISFLMQISHGAYYGFYSLYLANAGFSGFEIGLFWCIGVIAEIVLMWRWSRPIQQLAPSLIFIATLVLAALRWFGIGLTTDPLLLTFLQLLHAASFAAFHVAAITWVRRLAPESRHSTAQGLYSAAGFGLGSTIGIMGCGLLVDQFGYTAAFSTCAVAAIIAIPLALLLPKRGVATHEPSEMAG